MNAESLIRICYNIDECTSRSKDYTNCFRMSREYLKRILNSYSLNAAKIIDNPRSFSYDKDIYHVEIFDRKTKGHSFLLVRCRETNKYKLVQSFQSNYRFGQKSKVYTPKNAYNLLKCIASIKTYSKYAVNLISKITRVNNFEFSCI